MADRFHQGGGAKGNWTVDGAILAGGDITAGAQGTGGNAVYGRHHYANAAGGYHLYDLDSTVYECAKLVQDSSPALSLTFYVGNKVNGLAPCWTATTATLAIEFFGAGKFDATLEVGGDLTLDANINASHSGGVIWTGQSTTSGLVTPLIVRAKNSSGTVVSGLTFSNAGLITVTNNSGLAVSFQLTNSWAKADGFCATTEFNIGTVTSTATVDWSANGMCQRLTLTSATGCTLTFTAPPAPCWLTLKTISPASGTVPAITWPASVRWAGATKPAQAATLGRANVQRLYYDGTNYWGDAIVNAA